MLSAFIICDPRIIVIPWERCWVRIWLTLAPIRRFSRSRHASIMIMLSTSGSPVGFLFMPFDSSRRLTNSSRNTMMRGGRMPAGSMSMFSAPCSFCNASRRRPSRSIQSSMAAHSSNPVANPDSLPFTGAKSLPDFTGSPTNACQPCNRAAFTRVTAAEVLPLIVCPVISRCAVSCGSNRTVRPSSPTANGRPVDDGSAPMSRQSAMTRSGSGSMRDRRSVNGASPLTRRAYMNPPVARNASRRPIAPSTPRPAGRANDALTSRPPPSSTRSVVTGRPSAPVALDAAHASSRRSLIIRSMSRRERQSRVSMLGTPPAHRIACPWSRHSHSVSSAPIALFRRSCTRRRSDAVSPPSRRIGIRHTLFAPTPNWLAAPTVGGVFNASAHACDTMTRARRLRALESPVKARSVSGSPRLSSVLGACTNWRRRARGRSPSSQGRKSAIGLSENAPRRFERM